MVIVQEDVTFFSDTGKPHKGFYMDGYLKNNLDDYFIKAVKNKFDGVLLVSGMEGSGKTTLGGTIAKYCDPTFPGELINDDTPRRTCERVVFTVPQMMEAIDAASIGQAIMLDEAIFGMFSQDAGSEIQKALIKKFVTIRKKRLYIFIIIPSIFFLRKYFAIFRTRGDVHCTVKNGIERGQFNFYSYDAKRLLYLRGLKEFNQLAYNADFFGAFTDTEGYFYDTKEYDDKKEAAIKTLSGADEKPESGIKLNARQRVWLDQRNQIFHWAFHVSGYEHVKPWGEHMNELFGWTVSHDTYHKAVDDGEEINKQKSTFFK